MTNVRVFVLFELEVLHAKVIGAFTYSKNFRWLLEDMVLARIFTRCHQLLFTKAGRNKGEF